MNNSNYKEIQQDLIRVIFEGLDKRIYVLLDKKVRLLEVAKFFSSFVDLPPDQIILKSKDKPIHLDHDSLVNGISDLDIIHVEYLAFPSGIYSFFLSAIDAKLKSLRKKSPIAVFIHSSNLEYISLFACNKTETLGRLKERYQIATMKTVEKIVRIGKDEIQDGQFDDDTELKNLGFEDDIAIEVKLSDGQLYLGSQKEDDDYDDEEIGELYSDDSSLGELSHDEDMDEVENADEKKNLLEMTYDEETSDEDYDVDKQLKGEDHSVNIQPEDDGNETLPAAGFQSQKGSSQQDDEISDSEAEGMDIDTPSSLKDTTDKSRSTAERFKMSIGSLFNSISGRESKHRKLNKPNHVIPNSSVEKTQQSKAEVPIYRTKNVDNSEGESNDSSQEIRSSNSTVPVQSPSDADKNRIRLSSLLELEPSDKSAEPSNNNSQSQAESPVAPSDNSKNSQQQQRSFDASINVDDTTELPPGNQQSAVEVPKSPPDESTQSTNLSSSSLRVNDTSQEQNKLSLLSNITSSSRGDDQVQKSIESSQLSNIPSNSKTIDDVQEPSGLSQLTGTTHSNSATNSSSQDLVDDFHRFKFNFTGPIKLVRSIDGDECFRKYLKEYKAESGMKNLAFRHMNNPVKMRDTPRSIKASPDVTNTVEAIQVELEEITFALRDVAGTYPQLFFKAKSYTKLKKSFDFYAKKNGLILEKLHFSFQGRTLRRNDTPDDLELENGSHVDVMIKN